MILLDAYALIALLADEPAAEHVGRLISGGDAAVPSPNLAESADRLGRVHGISIARTRAVVESLEQSAGLRLLPATVDGGWRAAELRTKHYHRSACPLSLGDCFLLAMTGTEDRLTTADGYILSVAADEGIEAVALPDSTGGLRG